MKKLLVLLSILTLTMASMTVNAQDDTPEGSDTCNQARNPNLDKSDNVATESEATGEKKVNPSN